MKRGSGSTTRAVLTAVNVLLNQKDKTVAVIVVSDTAQPLAVCNVIQRVMEAVNIPVQTKLNIVRFDFTWDGEPAGVKRFSVVRESEWNSVKEPDIDEGDNWIAIYDLNGEEA